MRCQACWGTATQHAIAYVYRPVYTDTHFSRLKLLLDDCVARHRRWLLLALDWAPTGMSSGCSLDLTLRFFEGAAWRLWRCRLRSCHGSGGAEDRMRGAQFGHCDLAAWRRPPDAASSFENGHDPGAATCRASCAGRLVRASPHSINASLWNISGSSVMTLLRSSVSTSSVSAAAIETPAAAPQVMASWG